MAKYSSEFKKMLAKEYLSEQGGWKYIAEKYGLHGSNVERWIANYRQFGEGGLNELQELSTVSEENSN